MDREDTPFNGDDISDIEEKTMKHKKPRKSAAGRKLMRWNPDVDQLTLLAVDAVCVKQGIPIPWDAVAAEVDDNLTGEAIKQHLTKVHKYRLENDRKVPKRPEKGGRRPKVGKVANGSTSTPARSGRKGVKKEESDDEDADTPAKGASLLWHTPIKPKKPKTPKKEVVKEAVKEDDNSTPKTPANIRGAGRKKAKVIDDDEDVPSTNNKSTGKRGRKSKATPEQDDEDEGISTGSPSKKQKTITLRPAVRVNYEEPSFEGEDIFDAAQDGEDGKDDEYQESQEGSTVKMERHSSQDSNGLMAPPPKFNLNSAFTAAANAKPMQRHNGPANTHVQQVIPVDDDLLRWRAMAAHHQQLQAEFEQNPNRSARALRPINEMYDLLPALGTDSVNGFKFGSGMQNHNGLSTYPQNGQGFHSNSSSFDSSVSGVSSAAESKVTVTPSRKKKIKSPKKGSDAGDSKAELSASPLSLVQQGMQGIQMPKFEDDSLDVFANGNGDETGIIPIANDTGLFPFTAPEYGFAQHNTNGQMSGSFQPAMQSQAHSHPQMADWSDGHVTNPFYQSNAHYGNGNGDGMNMGGLPDLHHSNASGVTPAFNNFSFTSDGSQYEETPSQSSSFVSMQSIQSGNSMMHSQHHGMVNGNDNHLDPDASQIDMAEDILAFFNVNGGAAVQDGYDQGWP